MRINWRGSIALLTLWVAVVPVVHGQGLGVAVGVSSDDRWRGLSQSAGDPSVQVDLHYIRTSWYGGGSAEAVRRPTDRLLGAELIVYGGYEWTWSNQLSASLTLRHYDYPQFSRRYDELAASMLWGTFLRTSVTGSPDTPALQYAGPAMQSSYRYRDPRYSDPGYGDPGYGDPGYRGGRRLAFSYELAARLPLPFGLYAGAGIGYYDVHRQAGEGYGYGSIGVGGQWHDWDLDLRYIGTDARARALFGTAASSGLSATVLWNW